jgi:hypothetical protein
MTFYARSLQERLDVLRKIESARGRRREFGGIELGRRRRLEMRDADGQREATGAEPIPECFLPAEHRYRFDKDIEKGHFGYTHVHG